MRSLGGRSAFIGLGVCTALVTAVVLAMRHRAAPPQRDAPIATLAPGVALAFGPLLGEIDARWPLRNRASDGTLGDAAHLARKSDHNTGLALDVTNDPVNGPPLTELAAALLRDPRTAYVIFDGRIANPGIKAGAWRRYTGPNPHRHHLHLSISAAARDDVAPWDLTGVQANGEPIT